MYERYFLVFGLGLGLIELVHNLLLNKLRPEQRLCDLYVSVCP